MCISFGCHFFFYFLSSPVIFQISSYANQDMKIVGNVVILLREEERRRESSKDERGKY